MAKVRSPAILEHAAQSERVDGASVAPATPRMARARMSIPALLAKAAKIEAKAEGDRADHQELAPPDPVAKRAHHDQRAGDEKAVDVDDPEELGGARLQVGAELRHGEVQDVRSIE